MADTNKRNLELGQLRKTSPAGLRLDVLSPRLPRAGGKSPPDERVINVLRQEDELGELRSSFAENGYPDFEPLAVLDKNSKGSCTVLESN